MNVIAGMEAGEGLGNSLGQGQRWGAGRRGEGDDARFERRYGSEDDDGSSSGSSSSSSSSSRDSTSSRRRSNNSNSCRNGSTCGSDREPFFSLERLLEVVNGEGWPGVKAAIFGTFSIDIRYGAVRYGMVWY